MNFQKGFEKKLINQIFNEYFNYQSPSFLMKDLYKDNKYKMASL